MATSGYQGTLIIKGNNVTDTLSDNNFNRAHFVRIQTTVANNLITLKDESGNTIGSLELHAVGDSIVIEKKPSQTLSSNGNCHASAVGSPH
jgi:hypothetical protein